MKRLVIDVRGYCILVNNTNAPAKKRARVWNFVVFVRFDGRISVIFKAVYGRWQVYFFMDAEFWMSVMECDMISHVSNDRFVKPDDLLIDRVFVVIDEVFEFS